MVSITLIFIIVLIFPINLNGFIFLTKTAKQHISLSGMVMMLK